MAISDTGHHDNSWCPVCCVYLIGVDVRVRVMMSFGVLVAVGLMITLVGDLVNVFVGERLLVAVADGRVALGV